jgi:hypothetical protein
MLPPANLSSTAQPLHPGPETFHSQALSILLERFHTERKHHVLELGPACGANVEFFSGFRCKIYVADLFRALSSESVIFAGKDSAASALFERLLPYEEETRFDVILAWDLFNYLKADVLSHLATRLRRSCRRGTVMFALGWGRAEIPAEPVRFRISKDRRVTYDVSSPVTRVCPRYAPREMERLMPGFRISRSFLLRNGLQEYVFTFT